MEDFKCIIHPNAHLPVNHVTPVKSLYAENSLLGAAQQIALLLGMYMTYRE